MVWYLLYVIIIDTYLNLPSSARCAILSFLHAPAHSHSRSEFECERACDFIICIAVYFISMPKKVRFVLHALLWRSRRSAITNTLSSTVDIWHIYAHNFILIIIEKKFVLFLLNMVVPYVYYAPRTYVHVVHRLKNWWSGAYCIWTYIPRYVHVVLYALYAYRLRRRTYNSWHTRFVSHALLRRKKVRVRKLLRTIARSM